jgi:hypothetical protein
MDSFLFSIRATAPVFLVMVLGWILRRLGLLDDHFCRVSDKFVFTVALPVMLFSDMAVTDLRETFDLPYVLFCAVVTTIVFFSIWGLARRFLKEKDLVGEFVQVSYRSSAAILGCAIIQSIYGDTGMAPLMIIGSVPLFNIYAVLVLTIEGPKGGLGSRVKDTAKAILTNPIILGILLGIIPAVAGLTAFPPILDTTLGLVSRLATPLALLSLGATFQGKAALGKIKLSAVAAGIKLLLLPALFLPVAVKFGFTDSKLVALIVMLGSTSTPTCYIMARNLGHEGTLSASVIVLTTVCSAFTLTLWIFLCRYFGLVA